eukprot:m.85877 g.85877  ORF g.85877 m.85877 type:complete len:118 (+) comp14441_c0_seq4:979-1332(+)
MISSSIGFGLLILADSLQKCTLDEQTKQTSCKEFARVHDAYQHYFGKPDGLQVDKHGRLWATGPGGVRVYDQEGHLLGLLHTGRKTGNVLLTPEPDNSVYITADDMLLRIKLRRGLV